MLWFLKVPIFRGLGHFLNDAEKPQTAQRIFVLGGGSYDRGFYAARLWHLGFAPKIICTGENVSNTMKTLGLEHTEAELTRWRIQSLDVDSVNIEALSRGNSTMEESDIILELCENNGWNKIILVSDIFHTHRIRYVFEEKFNQAGIQVIYAGAPSSRYNEEVWWKDEDGLIMVNNEYIKLLYYYWKY